jgi:ABC-type oligopeptide transport system ATPase subunit
MKDGQLLETGPADKVLSAPEHPYTRQLLKASAELL